MNTDFIMRLLPDKWVVPICTCGPVGYWGKAPGTNGTVLGVILYTLLFHSVSFWFQVFFLGLLSYLAILICEEGEKRMMKRDPGEMIIDEVIAVPLCFLGMNTLMASTGHVWAYMLGGFVIFRVFDILKPFGIKKIQELPGGQGVVVDDLAAALATNLSLYIIVHIASL